VSSFLLIAETGLTLPDLACALYSETAEDTVPAALAVSEVEPRRYLVTGVPEYPATAMRVLTWATPTGNGARALPEPVGTPPFVVLPLRTPGAAAGLAPELWRNGVADATVLTVAEVGTGDARISGFPEGHGDWVLAVPWLGGDLVTRWRGTAASTALVAETIERRLLSRRLRDYWTRSPVAIPGVSFHYETASDVSPFTVSQVRASTGYVELTLHPVDTFQNDATSGLAQVAPGTERQVSSIYTVTRARFTIRLPGGVSAREQLLETYTDDLRSLFLGLRIVHPGPPKVILRQLPTDPPRVWRDTDDGDWRRRDLDVLIRRWERREHAGVLEVAI
jgi:hypothetical protein